MDVPALRVDGLGAGGEMPAVWHGFVMTRAQFFPAALIVLNLGAVVAYGLEGDWRRAIYWGAAAVLTAVVTF